MNKQSEAQPASNEYSEENEGQDVGKFIGRHNDFSLFDVPVHKEISKKEAAEIHHSVPAHRQRTGKIDENRIECRCGQVGSHDC
jgi:hypothetical protein